MWQPNRREFLRQSAVIGLGAAAAGWLAGATWGRPAYAATGQSPIKIGVLHSLSGTMAISEVSLRDVVLMAVEEFNAKGGCSGDQSSRLW